MFDANGIACTNDADLCFVYVDATYAPLWVFKKYSFAAFRTMTALYRHSSYDLPVPGKRATRHVYGRGEVHQGEMPHMYVVCRSLALAHTL